MWEGKECQNFTISSELTDKGFCHSFNKDQAHALYSEKTGKYTFYIGTLIVFSKLSEDIHCVLQNISITKASNKTRC